MPSAREKAFFEIERTPVIQMLGKSKPRNILWPEPTLADTIPMPPRIEFKAQYVAALVYKCERCDLMTFQEHRESNNDFWTRLYEHAQEHGD